MPRPSVVSGNPEMGRWWAQQRWLSLVMVMVMVMVLVVCACSAAPPPAHH